MKRWSLEVTFEEGRAHLGIETQRQWSDLAIERSTPLLFGLYSLVTLFGRALHPDGQLPVAAPPPGIANTLPHFVTCSPSSGDSYGASELSPHQLQSPGWF